MSSAPLQESLPGAGPERPSVGWEKFKQKAAARSGETDGKAREGESKEMDEDLGEKGNRAVTENKNKLTYSMY